MKSFIYLRSDFIRMENHSYPADTGSHFPYGALLHNPALSLWLSVDPMADKYPGVSPYTYCADNPVRLVDVDGRKVKPFGEAALQMIKNTLRKEDRAFVRTNRKGFIKKHLLLSHKSNSLNYNNLKELVRARQTIEVHLEEYFTYKNSSGELIREKASYASYEDLLKLYEKTSEFQILINKDVEAQEVNGLSTGESGQMGRTCFPEGDGYSFSYNENISVYINARLSAEGAAEMYCHEANGHALLYLRNGNDVIGAGHDFAGTNDNNRILVNMILESRKETINNMNP